MPSAVAQIDLMVLFLDEDLSNLLRHRVLSKNFTLADAIAVVANGFIFVIEIISEHVFRIFRCAYRLWSYRGHFAEVIDLPREDKGMIELLLSVDFKLGGKVHVFGAAEHLGIDYVGDDGPIFAGTIFFQQLRKVVAGDLTFACDGLRHLDLPLNCSDPSKLKKSR